MQLSSAADIPLLVPRHEGVWGRGVRFHALITLTVHGGERLALPLRFTPGTDPTVPTASEPVSRRPPLRTEQRPSSP